MLIALLSMAGGLALLIAGGEGTVRGATSTASRLKIPPFVIGATVVAFGTSAPELVVTLTASLKGWPGLALGNIVGSNIANLGLILGIAALLKPVELGAGSLKYEMPVILGVMILMTLFGSNGTVGRIEGAILLAGLVVVIVRTFGGVRNHRPESNAPQSSQLNPVLSAVLLVVGIAALIGGGQLLVSGAVQISRTLGVSEYIIGAVIVAVGTSLPELAASVAAAIHGKGDLAIGNVFGSNTFNVLFVLGTGSAIRPIHVAENIRPDLVIFCGLTILPLVLLAMKNRIPRWCGLLLVSVYAAYAITSFTTG